MLDRDVVQMELDQLRLIVKDKGHSPEVEGMEHALMWVLGGVRPSPVTYANVIYGVTEVEAQ
jgi:hypothetical protein